MMIDNTYALKKIREEANLSNTQENSPPPSPTKPPIDIFSFLAQTCYSFFSPTSHNDKNYYSSIERIDSHQIPTAEMFQEDPKKLLLQKNQKYEFVLVSYLTKNEPLGIITKKRHINELTDLRGALPLIGEKTTNPELISRITTIFNCPTYEASSYARSAKNQKIRARF